jgi:hypothetical protein
MSLLGLCHHDRLTIISFQRHKSIRTKITVADIKMVNVLKLEVREMKATNSADPNRPTLPVCEAPLFISDIQASDT